MKHFKPKVDKFRSIAILAYCLIIIQSWEMYIHSLELFWLENDTPYQTHFVGKHLDENNMPLFFWVSIQKEDDESYSRF